jgi:DNA-directed RNA polymerase specialized sigma24 family protein
MGELQHPNAQLRRNGRRASGGGTEDIQQEEDMVPVGTRVMPLRDKGIERTLEARIRAARAREFVGRTAEQALFRSSLETDPAGPTFTVLWVHGPGGIGKSALLERFAEDAQAVDRPVVRVDGRAIDATPRSFTAAASGAADVRRVVVMVDNFERCDGLEEWLRQDFVPHLPQDAVVVVASRHSPKAGWQAGLGWSELLRVVALRNLSPADAGALLDARRVPIELHARLIDFAGGHPLALSLAAKVAEVEISPSRRWTPGPDIIRTLLSELVGAVPSAVHRHALEICAHAYDTTEELLRAVLGADQDADALFDWLRQQPFIEAGTRGVFPHDVAREALDADLRWRDPQGYEAMHRAIRNYLLEWANTGQGHAAQDAMRAISFLHRHGGVMPDFVTWQRQEDIEETDLRPGDRDAVLALAVEAEGVESAQIVDFWLSRQPAAFRVYRRLGTDEPIAFMAWLRLSAATDDETAADPVVAAAWHHSRSAGPVRSGEHLALARFMVYPPAYHRPSPVADLVQARILVEWLRSTRLAWSYLVLADPKFFQAQMDYLDQQLIPAEPIIGDRSYWLYGHDWRAVPVAAWLDRHVEQELFGPQAQTASPQTDLLVLSREEFDAAVRNALDSWHRPDRLTSNPLTRSRIAVNREGDPVTSLRETLNDAVGTLARDPRTEQQHRAAVTTFFHGVPTQEVAAQRLGLPLSTYRRHLSRALREICDQLWSRELYGWATD